LYSGGTRIRNLAMLTGLIVVLWFFRMIVPRKRPWSRIFKPLLTIREPG
jgi:hypothetical protein